MPVADRWLREASCRKMNFAQVDIGHGQNSICIYNGQHLEVSGKPVAGELQPATVSIANYHNINGLSSRSLEKIPNICPN